MVQPSLSSLSSLLIINTLLFNTTGNWSSISRDQLPWKYHNCCDQAYAASNHLGDQPWFWRVLDNNFNEEDLKEIGAKIQINQQ